MNGALFPGVNANSGASLLGVFTDDPSTSKFVILDANPSDANTYVFAFTSTLNDVVPTITTSTFNVILDFSCASAVVYPSNQAF